MVVLHLPLLLAWKAYNRYCAPVCNFPLIIAPTQNPEMVDIYVISALRLDGLGTRLRERHL